MNRIQFLKRLLATLFGAFTISSLRSRQSVGSNLPDDPTVIPTSPSVIPTSPPVIPSAAEESTPEPLYLYSGYIVGTYYYDAANVLEQLRHLDPLQLKLNPDNEFDFRAIEVWWNSGEAEQGRSTEAHMLGHIARRDNKVLYNLLKNGAQLEAHLNLSQLVHAATEEDRHAMLRLRVYRKSAI